LILYFAADSPLSRFRLLLIQYTAIFRFRHYAIASRFAIIFRHAYFADAADVTAS
jgi:hypothetical protein